MNTAAADDSSEILTHMWTYAKPTLSNEVL